MGVLPGSSCSRAYSVNLDARVDRARFPGSNVGASPAREFPLVILGVLRHGRETTRRFARAGTGRDVVWGGAGQGVKDYGLEVYRYGAVIHGDGRRRLVGPFGRMMVESCAGRGSQRGMVQAFSRAAQRRLAFAAANVEGRFRCLITLTYHANVESWEDDAERNRRIALRSKRDLNRLMSCLRGQLGHYLWVQEFQARGVVHFHLLAERIVSQERVALVWCRASDALDDGDALRHAAKVEVIEDERRVRSYVGSYLGKARQKVLPPGVECAGRWWGRSRGLRLALLEEVVTCEAGDTFAVREGVRIVRCVRRYLSKRFGFKFRGGAFVDQGGELSAQLQAIVVQLRAFFGTPKRLGEMLAEYGWEPVEQGGGS